jgi:ABC-type sugar transport system substrate-binding protein
MLARIMEIPCPMRYFAPFFLLLAACKPSPGDVTKAAEMAMAADRSGPVRVEQRTDTTVTKQAEVIKAEEGQKLVIVSVGDGREPFAGFEAGALRMALRGVDGMVVDVLDARGDAELQKTQLTEALMRKPAYLVVSAVDEKVVQALVGEFATAGVQVISADERLQGSGFIAAPHVVQRQLGEAAAQVAIEALTRKANGGTPVGRVVHLRGTDADFRSSQRAEGFFGKLKEQPGIQVVHDAPADWDVKLGRLCTEEALRLQQSFDVIVAQSDYLALGASQALQAAQRRESVMIIGMDALGGDGGGIDLVATSAIDATIHQAKPMQAAFRLIQAAEAAGQKIAKQPPQALKLEVINHSTVAEAMRRVQIGEL